MTHNSSQGAGFVVGINPEVAFSVFYDDGQGRLFFVIELGDDPKRIYLNPRPTQDGQVIDLADSATQARVSVAIERVKAYFEGQGLSVEID
jgi:hypothetical protein